MTKIPATFLAFVLSFVFFTTSAQRSDCGAYPEPNTITYADGSTITLIAKGTESVHYVETAEGYTVLENKDHIFEYAVTGMDGHLTSSGIKAENEFIRSKAFGKLGIEKHLRYSKEQRDALIQYHNNLEGSVTPGFGKAGNVYPPQGNRKLLVILMQYPNLMATIPKANFELLFNQPNYLNTGCFNDYYNRTSFNKLNIATTVVGWYTADSGYLYYKTNTTKLLLKALTVADSAVNYADFDTDGDTYVDAVMILHAGYGAEESSAPGASGHIWSFRSTLGSSPTKDGKKFSSYAMFPEKRFASGANTIVGLGVIVHEFGHIIDLPDLYATNFNGQPEGPEGVGNFAVMAGGGYLNGEKTPCLHDGFSKFLMGWLTPTIITSPGTYTIPKAAADSSFAFRINTSRGNEYFLLENKQKKGQDKYLPSRGLTIWHVNDQKAGKLSVRGNQANNDTSNLGLGLMQADGLRDLEMGNNRGDAKDLYPGLNGNKTFTPTSNPGSQLYFKQSGIRQNSGVYITNMTQNADSSVTFKFGASPTASFTPSATVGCVPFSPSFINSSIFAKTYAWNFGDGGNSIDFQPTHTFTTPGTYNIWLKVVDSTQTVSDSIMQTIVVSAAPKAGFNYTRSDTNIVSFTNTSTNANEYKWSFKTFTTQQPTITNLDLKQFADSGYITFTLVALSNGGCSDTFSMNVPIMTTFNPTAIAEDHSGIKSVSVYPNPGAGDLTIHTELERAQNLVVTVMNALGEKVYETPVHATMQGSNNIVLSSQLFSSAGVYFISIRSNSYNKVLRVIRN